MAPPKHLDLKAVRRELGLSQANLADVLGVSFRTVQSCEQGWRNPGPAVEKTAILLLLAHRHGPEFSSNICWEVVDCSEDERRDCPVYQTRQGHLCWLLSGNVCQGRHLRTWEEKKESCLECAFFKQLLPEGFPTR